MWDPRLGPRTTTTKKHISGKTGEIQIKPIIDRIVPMLISSLWSLYYGYKMVTLGET